MTRIGPLPCSREAQHEAGEAEGLVHAEGGAIGDADNQRAAARPQLPGSQQDAMVFPDVVASGEQRGKNVIESHGSASGSCWREQ